MPNQGASNKRYCCSHSHHITRGHHNQPGREKPAMPLTSTPLHQTALRGQPRRISSSVTEIRVRPPINRLPRISSNQRLHRRSNTLRHHTLRTPPKRAEELRRHANSMIGPCNLIQVLQPVLIQQCPTPSLLRIRVKNHQIKEITLIRYHIHKTRHHVVHVLRRRRMQRDHQERVTLSPTPVT